ncbi:GNAT family N-acetyltransferase [Anaerobacillus isosaccharinicus]|uniref:GNAT family N-acetyltransferase n=1 Tax=Anaerobacillus isosaccharinicus TaxID=1532552 RepID=A0A1S2M619_9BACI|nr:GNAT family N-acetyltransferase [Anaerobacillus isosaccharinicus]MBA5588209.1 GNAT family N-acetyltransferase [Anaerobacillus isosaccharinicus]QOY38343.1 GNAT family N-acetyltransferase [Anaerobacillus isosaccharinicus]
MSIYVTKGEKKNEYHAINEQKQVVGKGWIFPSVPSDIFGYPRLNVFIEMKVEQCDDQLAIKDLLFATLLEKAKEIRSENREKKVRVYHCCFSHDQEAIKYYSEKSGFQHDEGMYIIRKVMSDTPPQVTDTPEVNYEALPLSSEEDIVQLINAHQTVFRSGYSVEGIKELQEKFGWKSIAAIHNGEIVGNIMLWVNEENPNHPFGWVEDLFVTKDVRHKGIGKNLVAQALAHFRDLHVPEIRIEVWSANERAMNLYKQFGFSFYEETESSIGMFL